jgi:hypothetical protein
MTTLESSMLTLERRLRMGIVAVVAVSVPLILWWQVYDLDMGGGMAVGSFFPTAMVGWLLSKRRKPLWAIFWSTLGGIVWPVVVAIYALETSDYGGWALPILIACMFYSLLLGPIAGLYVSLGFWLAGAKSRQVKQAVSEI